MDVRFQSGWEPFHRGSPASRHMINPAPLRPAFMPTNCLPLPILSRGLALAGACLGFGLCLAAGGEPESVDFTRQVRPILSAYCFACHGPDAKARQADLRLDVRKEATIGRDGTTAIVPGHPESSELLRRVQATDADERMPPASTGKRLARADIQTLNRWIKQGAVYAQHWAYVRPVRPPLPEVWHRSWPRNPIDYFILARLEKEGLEPAPPADATALVRRVALDATGLPPRLEEIERFVADSRADAYERLVDEQVAKPSYGEHWARAWLDAARYADSTGYAEDQPREIWAFRDYVIRSINANKPFDRFTIEQIAGDLLPHPTDEQIVATAFHRNTQTNTEGGTDREEFRNVAVVDRVNTTWTIWMGTTMACAQCHDHKYDPISQKEFFRFFAIFNNTEDADRRDEAPLHSFWTDEQQREKTRLEREIARVEASQTPDEIAKLRKQLDGLKKQLVAIKPHTVPIIHELPANKRRVTYIQYRGNFLDRGPEVTPGVPAVFPPMPVGEPPNRLTLARWLVSPDNPLTARVTVNRYWEKIFGTGLVATSEDFGSQGELPSHPELLDWLATELVSSGWDIKHLLRLMLTSATYRQSSRATPELLARDLDNRLLARGPRFRMDAEVIRDQALSAAGLLSPKMYGPPVRPLQPAFGLSAALPADRFQLDAALDLGADPLHAGDRGRSGLHAQSRGGLVGKRLGRFHKERFCGQLQGMIRAVRNHPCVARYSLANESLPAATGSRDNPWRWLIDAAMEVDHTRPYVFEVNNGQTGPVPGMQRGHAQQMEHYTQILVSNDHLRGMGECAWATDGMEVFPLMGMKMRLNDWAHFAPWSWINFWPNFLEGMSHERHPWKANNHRDRRDDVDGWGSPSVMLVQRAIHPYLVVDRALLEAGPQLRANSARSHAVSAGIVPRYHAGGAVSRSIDVFNGGLAGRELELKWEARWDAPYGELFRAGRSGPIEIEPGFHATRQVEFALPAAIDRARQLYLLLESLKAGKTVYRDNGIHFQVLPAGAAASARFIGLDEKTQGDWRGKYGSKGHEVVAVVTRLPKDIHFDWRGAETYTWEKQTDDRRALVGSGTARIAACRYAGELNLEVDLTSEARRLSLYYVDWDSQRSKQTFTVWNEDGTVFDRREIGKIQGGCHLTWEVRGRVRITVEHQGGANAVVSGAFLD